MYFIIFCVISIIYICYTKYKEDLYKNVNFELYKVFYSVANNGSISKASEELLISQPAVTQNIQVLEGQLGVTLFIRTKKGTILTEEGKELYKYIKEGINYFVNGENKINNLKKIEEGTIRIGASTVITENFLMPYITQFHKCYPKIEIKLVNNLTDNLLKQLRNGTIDIVIGGQFINDQKDLRFYPLREISDIFISNKKLELPINKLLEGNIIIQFNPSITRSNFDKFIKDNNFTFKPYMEVVSHRLVTEFVKTGMGIGVVTKEYIEKELNNNELYEIKTNILLPKRNIGYIILDNYVPSFAVKKIIDILIKM